jgi:hypothetical protein
VAKEFLAKAGIKPDTGRLTERWVEALAAFHRGEFAKAHDLFDLVVRVQGSDSLQMAYADPFELHAAPLGARAEPLLLSADLVNPYVRDMKRRAWRSSRRASGDCRPGAPNPWAPVNDLGAGAAAGLGRYLRCVS